MAPILPSIHGVDPSMYLELPAIAVGAFSGGAHAADRGFDYVGVAVLAIATGLGGGMMRDVLLSVGPPLALMSTRYLVTVGAAAVVAFLFARHVSRVRLLLDGIDALSLGFFGIAGVDRALAVGLPTPGAVVVGVITAVGGSVIRDVLANETPSLMLPGNLYATPAALGIVSFLVMVGPLHFGRAVAAPLAITTTCALRLLSVHLGWKGPTPTGTRLGR